MFYFECNHGSKVFFEELGDPWPRHECFERKVEVVGRDLFARRMATAMMTIDKDYARRVQTAVQATTKRPKAAPREIFRQDPYVALVATEMGIVRELTIEVDVHRRFKVPVTTVGVALLGEFAQQDFGQVTIHTGALGDDDDFSYTFLVVRTTLTSTEIRVGDIVRCQLRGVSVVGSQPVWICDAFDSVT